MHNAAKQHLNRIKVATTSKLGRKDLPRWIEENTFINNKPFSFKGHEYQNQILLDESPELVIRKSAQTGISEAAMRMALGLLMVMPGAFRIGYTFPSATFASGYAKTRLNPIIQTSPALRAAISTADLDSAELKTFGLGKELYFKGAAVGNAAISTTLDMLVHDELSFSDPEIIGDYYSRLLHSEYKWRVSLSTPTFVGDPIDQAFGNSRRHWNMCKCEHCNHQFVPNYYEHVKVPGWNDLDTITANNLHLVRHTEAVFLCPKCGRATSLLPEYREWVCENPTENHIAAGYQVQPFDAPTIVTLSGLVIASTKYLTRAKFKQFSLGLPATDVDNGLLDEDLERCGETMVGSPFRTHVMGIDLGMVCHFVVGGVAPDGTPVVVHYERVLLKDFRTRYAALAAQYNVSIKVSDIQPYSDLIMSISAVDPNLYGARYVTRQGLETYDIKKEDPDKVNAIEGVREVSVNRTAIFDRLMAAIRGDEGGVGFVIRKCEDWELLKKHVTGMKRATATLRNGEFQSNWVKPSDGQDHYFHALGYFWIAAQMRGIATGVEILGMGLRTFKITGPKKK